MKNYEEMSDFEINKRVALIVGVTFNGDGEPVRFVECDTGAYADFNEIEFDPCNNPEDAWPIVVENDIALLPSCGFDWVAISHLTLNGFSSYIDQSLHGCLQHNDMNPLRAAMIVFLKMNEDKL